MNCANCGRALAAGARQCVYCGRGTGVRLNSNVIDRSVPRSGPPPRRKGGLVVFVVFLLIGAAVAAVVAIPDLRTRAKGLIDSILSSF